MGFLNYQLPPGTQLLTDAVFGAAFPSAWSGVKAVRGIANAAFPDLSNSQNNYNGLKLELGSELLQQNFALAVTGIKTFSMLLSGSPGMSAIIAYDLLSDGEIVFSHEDGVSNINEDEFNNNYITFTIPDFPTPFGNLTEGRVRITIKGDGNLRLSNPKLEDGDSPTRFSVATGEPDLEGIPETRTLRPPGSDDPLLAPFDFTENFGASNNLKKPGDSGIDTGGEAKIIQPGEATFGVNYEGLFEEYDFFNDTERDIFKKALDQKVNKQDGIYYPSDADLGFLNFTRKKLKDHLNQVNGTNARSRAFASWAKVKLAGMRRAYEMRMHSRLDFYSFTFIDDFLYFISLQEEKKIIHEGAGAT